MKMSCQISWSSPEEQHYKIKKQSKLWRKFRCIDVQAKGGRYLLTPEKDEFKNAKDSEMNVNCTQEILFPSPCNLIDLEDSPVIGSMTLSDSPLIKQSCVSKSPIIGKKRKRRHKASPIIQPSLKDTANFEIKRKFPLTFDQKFEILKCNKPSFVNEHPKLSPDIFSEVSPNIEISDSPNRTQYVISEVNSQHSSIVINSSTISPQSKPSLESLYYQVPNPKKKRFKRGGLASQTQKHLKSERANVAIWKHENYLCKNGEYSISPMDESLIISLNIKKVWDEFQSTYVLCNNTKGDEFIVLVNTEYVDRNKLEIGSFYKIYPPYSEYTILYNKKDIKCYINITRLRKSDAATSI